MKKIVMAAAIVTVAAVAMLMWAPRIVVAQEARLRLAEPQIHLFRSGGASIGVTVREVTSEDSTKARLDGASGVFIESVQDGTPASRAGLRSGDIVVEFDGERVRSVQQFTRLVQETAIGRTVKAMVARDGSRQTLDVTPEDRSTFDRLRNFSFNVDALAMPEIRTLVNPRQLGATLTPLSDQLESYFGVTGGVLVSSVLANSPASEAGLKAGDVITQVNGRRVVGPDDVSVAIRNAEPGSTVDITVTREKKEQTLKARIPERRNPLRRGGVTL